jgi:hypothetical protein
MTYALHIYLDPCATPENLRLLINQYKESVEWIGILGSCAWATAFDDSKNSVEVIKGQWFLAKDRNRLTSLTPVNVKAILWLYGSDVVRFPQHLLIRGKDEIDFVSCQVTLGNDLYARTSRYRYLPRLVSKSYFQWSGTEIPYLPIPVHTSLAINKKSSIESKNFKLPNSFDTSSSLSHFSYEELIELLVHEQLNIDNSLPRLLSLAAQESLPILKRSLLLALAANFLLIAGEVQEAKELMTVVVDSGHLNVFHYYILSQLAYAEAEYSSAMELVNKGLAQPWPQIDFPFEPILIRAKFCQIYGLSALKLDLAEDAKATLLEIEESLEVEQSFSREEAERLSSLSGYTARKRVKKIWPNNSIVYYCGKGLEPWDESSLETGIGGSEAAVIYLSREWAKAGYQVTVFGSPKAEHVDSFGVSWRNYSECHAKDTFDIFIGWRSVAIFDQPVKARVSLLDCHDILIDSDIDALRLSRIHRLMVKSKFHRHNLSGLNDCQFEVISNGFDASMLNSLEEVDRDLHKIIYASSYDRGLEHMLRYGWPLIKSQVPEAELHLFYGWEGYDKMPDPSGKRAQWKKHMLTLMQQPGVFERGRIGHKQLLKEKQSASLHYYGCVFEETDCISVRESAVVGCIPVTTKYAALAEKNYLQFVEGDPKSKQTQLDLAERVVSLIQRDLSEERLAMQTQARVESWHNIADKWLDVFNN